MDKNLPRICSVRGIYAWKLRQEITKFEADCNPWNAIYLLHEMAEALAANHGNFAKESNSIASWLQINYDRKRLGGLKETAASRMRVHAKGLEAAAPCRKAHLKAELGLD